MSATAKSQVELILSEPHGALPSRPVISNIPVDQIELKGVCPVGAIGVNPVRIDLGKCNFCGECAKTFPSKIKFTDDIRVSSNVRDRLIVLEGEDRAVIPDGALIRDEVAMLAGRIVRLFVVPEEGCAAYSVGKQSAEMRRLGIEFVSSVDEAHGMVLISDVAEALSSSIRALHAMLQPPRLVILAGTMAINGGSPSDARQSGRNIISRVTVDLYVPGEPVHASTLAHAVIELTKTKRNTLNNIK